MSGEHRLEQIKQAYEKSRRSLNGTIPPWSALDIDLRLALIDMHGVGCQQGASAAFDLVQQDQQPLALTSEQAA